jgi:hypothetical protein
MRRLPVRGVNRNRRADTGQGGLGQRAQTSSRLTVVSGGVGQLSGVALECRDPAALAEFYSRLTGGLWSTRTQTGTR